MKSALAGLGLVLLLATGVTAGEQVSGRGIDGWIDQLVQTRPDPAVQDAVGLARAALIRIGRPALDALATRFADTSLPPLARARLLQVIAVSEDAAAAKTLAAAAASPSTTLRLLAADGLGAGRTPEGVQVLATLAKDPVPGVRAAALRSLFALESEAAIQTRQGLPLDPRPDLAARRLLWHRKRDLDTTGLLDLAREAYEHGRTPEERMAGAALLVSGRTRPPLDLAREVLQELGTDAVGAAAVRLSLGAPLLGYDPVTLRRIAIQAAWIVMMDPDAPPALRDEMIDRAVGWLARPVETHAFDNRPAPETVLRMVLPDFGSAVVGPTLRRLESGRFRDPQDGMFLLTESLPPAEAAQVLADILRAEDRPDSVIRSAAAEGLVTVGLIDDEDLARALIADPSSQVVRRSIVRVLAREPKAWATALLGELLGSEDRTLRDAAIASLEQRRGEGARRLLVDDLFSKAEHPQQRLMHLVAPGDDLAFEVLERALSVPRASLRLFALERLSRTPSLLGERGRALALGYAPRATKKYAQSNEFQQLLHALISQAPDRVVPFVREHWAAFEAIDWEAGALKTLQNLRGKAVDGEVIDLVLEKVRWDGKTPHGDDDLLVQAGTALAGRRGHRDDDLDRFWRALLLHPSPEVVNATVLSIARVGGGNLEDVLLPLLDGLDLGDPEDMSNAHDLLVVLARQPGRRIEEAFLNLVLDAHNEPALRREAAHLLVGRISESGRVELLDWLLDEEGKIADATVQRVVARVVGTGAPEAIAARIQSTLATQLEALYRDPERLDPDKDVEPFLGEHLGALARAVAFAGHETPLADLARTVFHPPLATYARRSIARQACRMGTTDASAAARDGPPVLARWHRAGGPYCGLPQEALWIVYASKVVPDALLAQSYRTAIGDGRDLSAFPDLYFDRIVAQLHDRRTSDLAETAAVLEDLAWRAEPVGGAVDFGIARDRVLRSIWAKALDTAEAAQERVVSILARRGYDDDKGWNWRRERGILEALRAGVLVVAGNEVEARARFEVARRYNPYDPSILITTAWIRAVLDFDLDPALEDALRATTLERRRTTRGEASETTSDILAYVHLRRGEFEEAAALLERVLRRTLRHPHLGGRHQLHFAEAVLHAGHPAEAKDALERALFLEPSLADEIREDEAFGAWREDGRLERLLEKARRRFLDRMDED